MNYAKTLYCKICGKKHCARGFCKAHLGAFYRGLIDESGKPRDGYFFDFCFHLKKVKDTLRETVRESDWYREWVRSILKRDGRRCVLCGRGGVRLCVHHNSKRMSDIVVEAKAHSDVLSEQVEYCRQKHLSLCGISVCKTCHAKEHEGEKIHALLSGEAKGSVCKVCGSEAYCKGFCSRHYAQHRRGIVDGEGVKIRDLRLNSSKGVCVVCGEESKGRGGLAFRFCRHHLTQYQQGILDGDGNQVREIRHFSMGMDVCKVCGGKYYSKGFCLTHYNRFKIGQIDFDGKEIRPLQSWTTKGSKAPVLFFDYNGRKLSIAECAESVGIHTRSMRKRIKRWGIEKAMTTPAMVQYRRTNDR